MYAVCYLRADRQRQRLEESARGRLRLIAVADWFELDRKIRSLPIEIAVVNPCVGRGVEIPPVERLRSSFPSIAILLYMPFSPEVVDALLRLGNVGVHRAVFVDHDDTPEELSRALDELIPLSLSERMITRIFNEIGIAPREIVVAFRVALQNVHAVRTAIEWSQLLGMAHRSFYRMFRVYDLPTPKICLMWLRLMYAARLLEDPGYSLSDVVRRLGYGTPSNFWQHVQDTLGLRVSDLRYAADFEALLERFVKEHVDPPEGTGYSAG